MRSLSLVPLAVGLVVGLAWTGSSPVRAADEPEEKVKFDTVDQVELHGTYYPSNMGRKAPCVLLLHKIGGSSSQDGWDKLAKELQKAGCAVLTFDFRGHGDSTTVDPMFWDPRANALGATNQMSIKTFKQNKPPETISYKDFSKSYYPYLVNDIAAAKLFLDRKNDSGDCNSANTIVIGADDGATLGLMWMASEHHRLTAIPNPPFPPKLGPDSAGKDEVCALWLSMSPSIGGARQPINSWLKIMKEKKVPMGFLYGAQDDTGARFAQACVEQLKPEKKQIFTAAKAIPKTKLQGSQLLSSKLDTVDDIVTYVKGFQKAYPGTDWGSRDFEKSVYVWRFPNGIIQAHGEREKTLNPIPLKELGVGGP